MRLRPGSQVPRFRQRFDLGGRAPCFLFSFLLWILPGHPVQAQSIQLADDYVSIDRPQVIDLGEQSWIDAAAFPNGDLVVADMFTGMLSRIGRSGERRWTVGHGGEGPGEFRRLYRVGVGPGDIVIAYDLERRDVSVFTGDGEFINRVRLEAIFRQVDSILMPSPGMFIVSGTCPIGSPQEDYAVHVFDAKGHYERSFGPLPETEQREILGYWGAGMLRRTVTGDILYTRRLPYEVYRYSPTGELKSVTNVAVRITGHPEDRYEITRNGPSGAFRIQRTQERVTYPIATVAIGDGLLLTSRSDGQDRYLTLVREEGDVLADRSLEPGEGILVDNSAPSGTIWMSDSSSGLTKVLINGRVTIAR